MKTLLRVLFAISLFSVTGNAYSEDFTTKGMDFWYGYMTNEDIPTTPTYTYISTQQSASGRINIPVVSCSESMYYMGGGVM